MDGPVTQDDVDERNWSGWGHERVDAWHVRVAVDALERAWVADPDGPDAEAQRSALAAFTAGLGESGTARGWRHVKSADAKTDDL